MTPPRLKLYALWLVTGLLVLVACHPSPTRPTVPRPAPTAQLTDTEQIAGEIMAYLMEVVLGRAGDPQGRPAWATRGANLPLDFDLVVKRMFGPVPLRAELMVLDTNILGLSEVLYHYDRRLNLFKGMREHDSLYPCAELMAIRLLLIHKLDRGEKVNLAAMIRHKELFEPDSRETRPAELKAMNLTSEEFSFLKAIFQSEPAFLRYMEHPFLVSTLKRIRVVEQDGLTLAADQMANYREWACPSPRLLATPPVTIAILPSMTALFNASKGPVAPSPEYQQLLDQLESAILARLARKGRHSGRIVPLTSQPIFFTPYRPMVIHTGNAGRVVEDVCPNADFTLILLGKNVYRAMHIDPENDIYPNQRRIYLDVSDIRYGQIDDEIETVVDAVMPALTAATPHPIS